MSILKQRFLGPFAATLIAIVLGSLGGYELARAITARIAESRLEQYATRIMTDGEASASELRTVLAAVSASPHPFCSDAEVGYFRALIFESEYLKDAGRMRDGNVLCSAALGRQARAQSPARPDIIQQDGTEVYKNLSLYRNGDLTVITLKLGDSFVVFTPLTRMHPEPAPMHFSESLTDAPTQRPVQLLGEPIQANSQLFVADGQARLGDTLYATRCSIRFFDCVTSFTTMPEMIQANRGKFYGCTALCGVLSAMVCLAFSLLYRRNKSMEQQLRRAISRDRLRVVYQPFVHLASQRIVGAEALVRWTGEDGIAIGPDVFVKLAEERGFVGAITKLVLRHALSEMGATLRAYPDFRLSINVAAADLCDSEFLPMLDRSLRDAAIPAKSLAIEITEGSTACQDQAKETIHRLRERGHSVHIDDFGTGYSSLAYLHDLSVDAIKIDRAFTQAIGTGSVVVAIVPQILAMAEALKLEVIVEGVETAQQANYFAEADSTILAQGWLFGMPVPALDFQKLLTGGAKKAPGAPGSPLQAASTRNLHAA